MQGRHGSGGRRWIGGGVALLVGGIVVVWGALLFGGAAHANPARPPARPATGGRIAAENALPGTDSWAAVGNYDINQLAAYAGATSVNAGDPIAVHVMGSGTALTATLYRMGYYQDHGARQYATYPGLPIT